MKTRILVLKDLYQYNSQACEQALRLSVWGKNSREREGKGGGGGVGEPACRQTFEAAILPSCNYLAEHLSVRSLAVNQFRA